MNEFNIKIDKDLEKDLKNQPKLRSLKEKLKKQKIIIGREKIAR